MWIESAGTGGSVHRRVGGGVLAVLGALCLGLVPAVPASAAELTIRLCGMANRTGNLSIAVFSQAHAVEFTEPLSRAFSASVTLRLADAAPDAVLPLTIPLPPGKYAVRVIHDENANDILDRGGLVGLPKESYGYSRNARARVAAVQFDDAAVTLGSEPLTIDVRIAPWSLTGGDDSPCPP